MSLPIGAKCPQPLMLLTLYLRYYIHDQILTSESFLALIAHEFLLSTYTFCRRWSSDIEFAKV